MKDSNPGKIIISYRDLDVRLTRHADENILGLLDNTTLGTRGGMRYKLMNIGQRVEAYCDNIRFVSLYLKGRLAGTVGFCYRMMLSRGQNCHGSYLRYLAFLPRFQAALNAKAGSKRRGTAKRSGSWKDEVLAFFRKPHMLDFPGYEENEKHVVYAYVESRNERSKNIIQQLGFKHIRTFRTIAFSRLKPRRSKGVSKLQEGEKDSMKKLLASFYANHTLYTEEFIYHDDRYYVIKEDEEILAGLSVVPASLRLVDMPGLRGKVLMKLLPLTPGFKKIFRPEELRFMVFEAIWCKEGKEKSLEKLMESVCAIEGYNLGLTWIDDRSSLYELTETKLNMGALNRMLDSSPGLVYANFINYTEKETEIYFDCPAYISGFDFT